MSQFRYKTRDVDGQLETGIIAAANPAEASRKLRVEGRFVVSLEDAGNAPVAVESDTAPVRRSGGRVPRKEVITFAHQLAVMLDTGVPISEALECASEQTSNEPFRVVLDQVTEHVRGGGELSVALGQHPRVFPVIMTSLIRASESTGNMGAMLERVSTYLQKESATVRKIRGALIYPAIMLVTVICVVIFLLTFVLPRFTGIYASKGAALPLPTQMLMTFSDTLTGYWWGWLAGGVGLAVFVIFGGRTATGRRVIDWLKLHVPLISGMFRRLYLTRGCRTLGTMINAGVPILDMIPIVSRVTANVYYEEMWLEVDEKLRRGAQLSDGLFTSPLIPRSVAQMVYSGEKAGRLGRVLERVAEYTEEEFDTCVRQTTQYIEPAMIVVMGSIIGFVAIALLMPIFSIGSLMSQ